MNQKLTLEQKKKGIKEEFTYVNSNGRISKQYTYKGMIIKWDNMILNGKWFYWRHSYYASLDATIQGIDRHLKLYNNQNK
jgi:hypothetical protein